MNTQNAIVGVRQRYGKSVTITFDKDALFSEINHKFKDFGKFCKKANVSYASLKTYSNGALPSDMSASKMAEALKVPIETFYTSVYNSDLNNSNENNSNTKLKNTTKKSKAAETSSTTRKYQFKELGNEKNIINLFNIINSNILTLSKMHSEFVKQYNTDKTEVLDKLNELAKEVEALHCGIKVSEHAYENHFANIDVMKDISENDIYKMSFKEYKTVINRLVDIINHNSDFKDDTFLQTLLRMYSLLGELGFDYEDAKDKYEAKHSKKAENKMQLIYDDKFFRLLFYQRLCSEVDSSTEIVG